MFKACLIQIKKEGSGETEHKDIISDDDLTKLYESDALDVNSRKGLQNKVSFELMLYFCYRGRENLREMKPDDFTIATDSQGRRYVKQTTSKSTKKHREDIADDDKSCRMYELPGNKNCPGTSFEKYIAKLNPDNPFMWQRAKDKYNSQSTVWYDNSPLGKNTLGQMMQNISGIAGLSFMYTNHCIRATCITLLDNSGCEARHIIGVSGHKSRV